MELKVVKVGMVEGCNVILGMAHFIKTVEDLYEALVNSVPNIKFGLAFCESSGPCLVRSEGTDEELKKVAEKNALALSCGHCFIIYLRNAYPINVLGRIRDVPEVCTVYAATANPLEIIVVETEQGRGVLGVVDGFKSAGLETAKEVEERKTFLRNINYKL
ncbi:MAG: adenosine-specific kinase [Candidatus Bathyarchaeota archaeon]|jgi:adenosine/AMP kinase|nr:adenosine-specific kinase [Candidatus Bathyarchaeota archaeon]